MASVGTAVMAACQALRAKLDEMGTDAPYAELLRRRSLEYLEASAEAAPGNETKQFSSAAFGAIFVEARVDPDLASIRVPRVVGVYDAGQVINPKHARSQCIGGIVGGIGMALHEIAEWDENLGKVMNANLADYLVPVNADMIDVDVEFIPASDTTFNALGAKGLAEIVSAVLLPRSRMRCITRPANESATCRFARNHYSDRLRCAGKRLAYRQLEHRHGVRF
jgi:xanthine dehydrogenase YagR molybdenum-binding subunit